MMSPAAEADAEAEAALGADADVTEVDVCCASRRKKMPAGLCMRAGILDEDRPGCSPGGSRAIRDFMVMSEHRLIPDKPFTSYGEYLAAVGSSAVDAAR